MFIFPPSAVAVAAAAAAAASATTASAASLSAAVATISAAPNVFASSTYNFICALCFFNYCSAVFSVINSNTSNKRRPASRLEGGCIIT